MTAADMIPIFLENMRQRGCVPNSVAVAERVLYQLIHFTGWTQLDQMSREGAVAFLDARSAGGWSDGTRDQAASVIRSWGQFLFHTERLSRHVFDPLDSFYSPPGTRYRPLTLTEVRKLVVVGVHAHLVGFRAKGNRPLLYAVMALTGMRPSEASQLKWRDVTLIASIPYVSISRTWARARLFDEIPLNHEVHCLLMAQQRWGNSDSDCPVFSVMPNRHTVQRDFAEAGIAAACGGVWSVSLPSLRLFFLQSLAGAPVSPTVFVRVARDGDAESRLERLADVDPQADHDAVNTLPRIWPDHLSLDRPFPWLS